MKTAIVLSGGGAKGAYQMGVWKALRKLHIKYQIITGTSVGALNGALMVQNSYYKAMKIWKNITYSDICGKKFEDEIKTNNDLNVYKEYAKAFFEDGGLSINSLERLFGKCISKTRMKLSKINYGIITVNISTLKPVELTKNDLLESSLKDYVLASASCFPAFKKRKIGNDEYVDGGYYDNLPINLAIKLGAERVIAVDLRAPGIKKIVTDKSVEVTKIYPRNQIGSFLVFNPFLARRAIQFGYNDTMKTFNKLDGNKYTFKKGSLLKNYYKYRQKLVDVTSSISQNSNLILNTIISFNDVNSILKSRNFSKLLNNIIEYLGKTYGLDEALIYSANYFNSEILYEFEQIGNIDKMNEKTMVDSRYIISYIYNIINTYPLNTKKVCKTMVMFKKEFMAALYITALTK